MLNSHGFIFPNTDANSTAFDFLVIFCSFCVYSLVPGVWHPVFEIVSAVQEMAKASEEKAKEDVKETETKIPTTTPEPTPVPATPSTPSTPSTPEPSTPVTGSGNGTPEVGDVVTYTSQYMFSSRGANPAGSENTGIPNAVVIDRIQPDSRWWHPTHPYHIRPASNPNGDYG